MSETALGGAWYRIAETRPRLRSHAQIHRQRFRGETWYVLQDHQSGRFFRVSAAANLMLCLMDGRRTVEQIWEIAGERFGDERPSRDDTAQLLVHLHHCDLTQSPIAPDMSELERRASRQRRSALLVWLKSPMAMRFPLFDPDRFLNRTAPYVAPLFSLWGLLAWLALVGYGAFLAAMHWPELSANALDRAFALDNLALLLAIYPLIKTLHELGHAYATKTGGGEVHELGVMLLVFTPVPYVDASSSNAFQAPWRRALVGAAGIMVELALAAVAMIVWLQLPPGFARAAAFNVMLIGGVSTVLVNGNPLLRFDGYYVLSDLIEIPNLDNRAKGYLLYLMQRYLLGVREAVSPAEAPGERAWFVGYGLASFVYRVIVMVGIAVFVANRYAVAGAVLAALAVAQLLVLPSAKALRYLAFGAALRRRRSRALVAVAALAAALVALLFVVPVPYATLAEGVVWVPDRALLVSGADGFVARLRVQPGDRVAAGDAVVDLEDPVVAANVDVQQAKLDVLRRRFDAVNLIDLVQADLLRKQIQLSGADLTRARERVADLGVTAANAGRLVMPDAHALQGRFVHKGDRLGYVVGPNDPTIRVVAPQADIDLVRAHTRAVSVRFTETIDHAWPARVLRETPAALTKPPAPALSAEGGGPMVLDPASPNHDKPIDKFYQVELAVDGAPGWPRIGGRVYVRFDHGRQPIAWRWLREARQLLMKALDV